MKKILVIVLVGLVMPGCQSSQHVMSPYQADLHRKVSDFYQEEVLNNQPIQFYPDDRILQIILIRHGEPALDKKSARSRKGMKQYVFDYDTVKVHVFSKSPVEFKVEDIDTVYSSPLVRARDTAHRLFGNNFVIKEDSMFREFEREVFPLPLFRLKPKTWGILSRIPWLLGLQSRIIEGFRNAKKRAKQDALFLEMKAIEHGRAVLVAHGFLNRYLNKYLQEKGWQLSYDGGKDYLSVQVLTKINVK